MKEVKKIPDFFGCNVFNDKVMLERLPKETYTALQEVIKTGKPLELEVANVVADAMKDWAIERGATHYCHWFQPLTGVTAEKHDSFIEPDGECNIKMKFSGKALVRGESDASSFPSGGLRATFEARGYTAWDPTSYAFILGKSLYIPTAFCSYGGHALDKKTPLIRSMEAIEKQALRILKLFGNTAKRVITTVGPEQEYFLIDKSVYEQREDLRFCKRTLFGAKPPKGQELETHYYGKIKQRVADYMAEVDEELWKLGIYAKTKHNEVAPAQHELAPVFISTNKACDHNQITMQVLRSVATKHDMVCLLSEKPFKNVNGSGKHNNWSLSTDSGLNLLEPGKTPADNAQFMTFLTAVISATDKYQSLLRMSVASAGNDHRLGASEAPPAIVSIFLGEELTAILDCMEKGEKYCDMEDKVLELGADILPKIPKDKTDRNRTSPMAFTGNKFEFRMLGSSASIATTNTVMNTIVADVLKEFADKLETSKNFKEDLNNLIKSTYTAHKRIIFNGNNYADEWVQEAMKRGLKNLVSTVDALPCLIEEQVIDLFERHKVLREDEIRARYDILLDAYYKTLHIEGMTMVDMVKKQILPFVIEYSSKVAKSIALKRSVVEGVKLPAEEGLLKELLNGENELNERLNVLEFTLAQSEQIEGHYDRARYMRDKVFFAMENLREVADKLETITAKSVWGIPTYTDILFSVKY